MSNPVGVANEANDFQDSNAREGSWGDSKWGYGVLAVILAGGIVLVDLGFLKDPKDEEYKIKQILNIIFGIVAVVLGLICAFAAFYSSDDTLRNTNAVFAVLSICAGGGLIAAALTGHLP